MSEVEELLGVECYAGYRGEQTPRRLRLGGRVVEVAAVADAWLVPGHRYFKLRGDDGALYTLRHAAAGGGWELTRRERSATGATGGPR